MTTPKPNSFEGWYKSDERVMPDVSNCKISHELCWQASRAETLRECLALLPERDADGDDKFGDPWANGFNHAIDEMRERIVRELEGK